MLLLVRNTSGNVPTWFNEGMAEYYSTFDTDDQKVVVGRPIASHVLLLREKRVLPLRILFQVDQKSPAHARRQRKLILGHREGLPAVPNKRSECAG